MNEFILCLARVSAAFVVSGEHEKADGVRLAAYHFALRRGALGTEYDEFLRLRHDHLAPIMGPHDWRACGGDGLCHVGIFAPALDGEELADAIGYDLHPESA